SDTAEMGRRYDDYELRLAAGETAMIHVQADNIDTVLQVFSQDGRGGQPLASDDDGGGGTNPFVFFAPEEAGTYVVRVVGFDEQTSGPYRLRISR
ncbi:MAG TPA: PPC domain-containing protein, partial [Allosphingosinicella sp.]